MSQQPNPPLRPQPPVRPDPASRRPPWPLIIGVALLGLLAGALLVALLGSGDDDPTASRSASPSPSVVASASGSAVPSPSPAATTQAAAPSATPAPGIAVDTIVASVVDGLAVRSAPGTDAERLGSIAAQTPGYVAAGPTDADGYRWFLLSGLGLPPESGCAGPIENDPFNCPVWFGWVAGINPDGEPWLVPHDVECPAEPLTAEGLIVGRTALERFACLGAEPFTFRAWWPEAPDAGPGGACAAQDEPSGWLLCQSTNPNFVAIDDTQQNASIGIKVSIDPESEVAMPERGTWVELRVHHDDPAAQGCDHAGAAMDEPDVPAEQWVLNCRAEMVVDEVTAVDGP
jgi:hypothetical protein